MYLYAQLHILTYTRALTEYATETQKDKTFTGMEKQQCKIVHNVHYVVEHSLG